jgi:hypothetical protein
VISFVISQPSLPSSKGPRGSERKDLLNDSRFTSILGTPGRPQICLSESADAVVVYKIVQSGEGDEVDAMGQRELHSAWRLSWDAVAI